LLTKFARFNGAKGLDSLLISSREGTTWLYYADGVWKRELIGIGEPKEPRQSPSSEFPGSGDCWGTGGTDVGGLKGDQFAYIAAVDPMNGIAACVYNKSSRGMNSAKWTRNVLDIYGTPNQLRKTGDGPCRYITCADFDGESPAVALVTRRQRIVVNILTGDGEDEFLLSLSGSLDRDVNGNAIQVKIPLIIEDLEELADIIEPRQQRDLILIR
jgi:hypothetical protein